MESFLQTFTEDILSNRVGCIFSSMFIGYIIGNIKIINFKFGNTLGTLIAATVISYYGGNVDPRSEQFIFSMFLFAVGYDSGENLSKIFNRETIKSILLSLSVMMSALVSSICMMKMFHFSKGTIVGITAGALTQSAIIQSANDLAISLYTNQTSINQYNTDVAVGFSVSYFFGLVISILWCSNILEFIFNKHLKTESLKLQSNTNYNQLKHNHYPKNSVFILCFGLILGIIIGFIELSWYGIKIKIGITGCLISGLFLGWINSKNKDSFAISYQSIKFMQDFCLIAFIATVGVSSGSKVIDGILHNGMDLIIASIVLTIIPLLTTTMIGFFILKYRNIAALSGAIAGARTANTACGSILQRCENNSPMQAFTIPFLISSILLTFLGPLILYLV